MIKISIRLKEIDYNELADKALPIILQNLSNKGDKTNKFVKLLNGMKGMPNKMIKAALSVMPQQTKDEIAVYFLTEYKKELIGYVNQLAKDNQIAVEVENFKASVQEGIKTV